MPFPAYATVEDNPPYKSVKDIYYEYFTELDEALNSFSDSAEPIFSDAGIDLVYKNDVSLWKKFGNSLRLRFAVRLSEVDREKCVAEANAALTSPCGLISSKADNAYMPQKRMVLGDRTITIRCSRLLGAVRSVCLSHLRN